jgi:hypothetical protein
MAFSLSRREESSKHKLSDFLIVCPHVIDWSKKKKKQRGLFYMKLLQRVIEGGESESVVGFN